MTPVLGLACVSLGHLGVSRISAADVYGESAAGTESLQKQTLLAEGVASL